MICTAHGRGPTHDFALYKRSRIEPHESLEVLADSGYQGLSKLHEKSKTPRKKPRKSELTDEQKQSNRELARRRVVVEHVIRSLKIFRILAERYRNRRKRFRLRFNLIAGLHNYELGRIWMFLEKDHSREYLVTAFGKRKGRGSDRPAQFEGLHVSHGEEHNVNFSPLCINYFQKHVSEINNAEILICHNHPRNFVSDLLSQIICWSPLPSITDRETMYQFKCRTITNWLVSGSFKSIRFYLVENRRLREIQLPPVERISQFLNWLETQTRP